MLCELCGCEESDDVHHLIPRTLHANKWFKKRYTREQMQAKLNVCQGCHRAVHRLIPREKDLGRDYNTREKLLAHEKLTRYVAWKRKRARRS